VHDHGVYSLSALGVFSLFAHGKIVSPFQLTCATTVEQLTAEPLQVLSSFLNQTVRFLCHWYRKLESATNVLWASEVKEKRRKHRKRMSDSLLQFFCKISSKPFD
jgi:hypothetical protein